MERPRGRPKTNPECQFCRCSLNQVHVPKLVEGEMKRSPTGRFGYHGDGLFCSLRCGYAFALRSLASAGEDEPEHFEAGV